MKKEYYMLTVEFYNKTKVELDVTPESLQSLKEQNAAWEKAGKPNDEFISIIHTEGTTYYLFSEIKNISNYSIPYYA